MIDVLDQKEWGDYEPGQHEEDVDAIKAPSKRVSPAWNATTRYTAARRVRRSCRRFERVQAPPRHLGRVRLRRAADNRSSTSRQGMLGQCGESLLLGCHRPYSQHCGRTQKGPKSTTVRTLTRDRIVLDLQRHHISGGFEEFKNPCSMGVWRARSGWIFKRFERFCSHGCCDWFVLRCGRCGPG